MGRSGLGQGRAGFAQTSSGTVRSEMESLPLKQSSPASSFGFLFPQPLIPDRFVLRCPSAWAPHAPFLHPPSSPLTLVLLGW